MSSYLTERAVLMRLAAGLPGEHRQDKRTTEEVKRDRALGANAGKWVKELYPEIALESVKGVVTEARQYHARVTLPFDSGIGILPAALIMEYGDKMKGYAGKIAELADEFCGKGQEWVSWALAEHNGTFDPKNYPGADAGGKVNSEVFAQKMRKRFYLRAEPLPVPDAAHFTQSVTSLLGVDAESVNLRVRDAGIGAQIELMKRLIEPVKVMAVKLAEQPKGDKEDIIFRDTLVSNLQDIANLGPKLNLADDPQINAFCREVGALVVRAQSLRDDKALRSAKAAEAAALAAKMEAYKVVA